MEKLLATYPAALVYFRPATRANLLYRPQRLSAQ